MITMHVCVRTVDRYDLEIAVLTLKFLMGCFYVVLNKTFTITSQIKMARFKEGRDIHRLSLMSNVMLVHPSFWNFWNMC